MNILYKPVKIETAAQVDPLPIGTVVFDAETDGWVQPHIKVGTSDRWFWMGDDEGEPGDAQLIGWTALVPTEVEEESSRGDSAETIRMLRDRGDSVRTRLVTPWEES